MADMIFNALTGALAGGAMLALVTFIWRYHALTWGSWMSHQWGRHLMAFSIMLTVLIGQSVAFRVFGEWPGRRWVLAITFGVFTVELWRRVYLNEVSARDARHARERRERQERGEREGL